MNFSAAGAWAKTSLTLLVLALLLFAAQPDVAGAASHKKKTMSKPALTALFIGDSFTVGAGSPNRKKGFAYQLASHYRWKIENYAVGHTGYVRGDQAGGDLVGVDCGSARGCPNYVAQLDQAISDGVNADVVMVSGGFNDRASAQLLEAAETLFTKLHHEFPKAKIYVTSPITTDQVTKDLSMRIAMIRVACFETQTIFLDLKQPLAGKKALRDHIHPNQKGHTVLAKVIAQQIYASKSALP